MTTADETVRPPRRADRGAARPRPVWAEKPSTAGRLGRAFAIVAVVAVVLVPMAAVVVTSLSSREAIARAGGIVVLPTDFSLDAYVSLLSGGIVARALLVSIAVTAAGTLLSTTITVLAAYGLSRPGSFGHRPLLFTVLLTFLFGPGIIPMYLTVKTLGLLNSYAALVLPGAVAAFHLVILRSFFMSLPTELIDSARIDGASELRILGHVVLPLSRAVIAVIALFYGVGYWNNFFNAVLYLDDTAKWPLQLVMRTYVLQGSPLASGSGVSDAVAAAGTAPPPALAVQMAIVVLGVIPVLFVYPFVQRHFVDGVLIGAVKG